MTNPIDLADVARRPRLYWNIDGLPELGMGLLWMLWGGAWLVGSMIPESAQRVYSMAVPGLLVVTSVGAGWFIKRAKARVTFPRTGFVEWKPPGRAQRALAAAVALLVAASLTRLEVRDEGTMMLATGLFMSLAFVVVAVRQRAPYFLGLAATALALGLAFAALDRGRDSTNWFFISLGAASALLGSVRLFLFLRRHPLPSAM